MPRITILNLTSHPIRHLRLHLRAEDGVLLAEEIDAGDILPADVIHHAVPARRRLASELRDPSGSGIGREVIKEEAGGVDAVHFVALRICEYDKGFTGTVLKTYLVIEKGQRAMLKAFGPDGSSQEDDFLDSAFLACLCSLLGAETLEGHGGQEGACGVENQKDVFFAACSTGGAMAEWMLGGASFGWEGWEGGDRFWMVDRVGVMYL